jgi:hypothetical protein
LLHNSKKISTYYTSFVVQYFSTITPTYVGRII